MYKKSHAYFICISLLFIQRIYTVAKNFIYIESFWNRFSFRLQQYYISDIIVALCVCVLWLENFLTSFSFSCGSYVLISAHTSQKRLLALCKIWDFWRIEIELIMRGLVFDTLIRIFQWHQFFCVWEALDISFFAQVPESYRLECDKE